MSTFCQRRTIACRGGLPRAWPCMRKGEVSPEWGDRLTPEILLAIRDKKLLPVAQMDRGFIFPEYPAQVLVSYFQAGSICDYIKQRWGDDKLLDMVHSLRNVEDHAGGHSERSSNVAGGVRQSTTWPGWISACRPDGGELQLMGQGSEGARGLGESKPERCRSKAAPEVLRLYPEYVGDANAYEFLAAAQLGEGRQAGAL